MRITIEITDEQRKLLLSLSQLLHSNDQVDLLIAASGGKTFAASSLSAAVVVLIEALEPSAEERDKGQARLDQRERLSVRFPSSGGFR